MLKIAAVVEAVQHLTAVVAEADRPNAQDPGAVVLALEANQSPDPHKRRTRLARAVPAPYLARSRLIAPGLVQTRGRSPLGAQKADPGPEALQPKGPVPNRIANVLGHHLKTKDHVLDQPSDPDHLLQKRGGPLLGVPEIVPDPPAKTEASHGAVHTLRTNKPATKDTYFRLI